MLTDLAKSQGRLDCLEKFAIDAAGFDALHDQFKDDPAGYSRAARQQMMDFSKRMTPALMPFGDPEKAMARYQEEPHPTTGPASEGTGALAAPQASAQNTAFNRVQLENMPAHELHKSFGLPPVAPPLPPSNKTVMQRAPIAPPLPPMRSPPPGMEQTQVRAPNQPPPLPSQRGLDPAHFQQAPQPAVPPVPWKRNAPTQAPAAKPIPLTRPR